MQSLFEVYQNKKEIFKDF